MPFKINLLRLAGILLFLTCLNTNAAISKKGNKTEISNLGLYIEACNLKPPDSGDGSFAANSGSEVDEDEGDGGSSSPSLPAYLNDLPDGVDVVYSAPEGFYDESGICSSAVPDVADCSHEWVAVGDEGYERINSHQGDTLGFHPPEDAVQVVGTNELSGEPEITYSWTDASSGDSYKMVFTSSADLARAELWDNDNHIIYASHSSMSEGSYDNIPEDAKKYFQVES